MLPYNRPDRNITPEDKANAHCPTFPAGRPKYSSKMQHQMSLFTKWKNYTSTPRKKSTKINSNKRKALLRPPETQSEQIPERKLRQKRIYFKTTVKV